jgi:predicted ATPase
LNPFRHSKEELAVSEALQLAQDGNNLAQVLNTIHNNNRPLFQAIEEFVHSALPDVGILQTPLRESRTFVGFRSPYENFLVRLHDMGGGIEQLLMVAVILLTTDQSSSLFLEEPETHLHASAQRYLLEQISQGERQIFASTHSPCLLMHPNQTACYIGSHAKLDGQRLRPSAILNHSV